MTIEERSKIAVFLASNEVLELEDTKSLSTDSENRLSALAHAIRFLNKLNLRVIILSNQPQISDPNSSFSWERYTELEELFHQRLEEYAEAFVDSVLVCDHVEAEQCECRLPKTGLLSQAMRSQAFSIPSSYIIGATEEAIAAGSSFGLRTVYVSDTVDGQSTVKASVFADTILGAVSEIQEEMRVAAKM